MRASASVGYSVIPSTLLHFPSWKIKSRLSHSESQACGLSRAATGVWQRQRYDHRRPVAASWTMPIASSSVDCSVAALGVAAPRKPEHHQDRDRIEPAAAK